MPTVSIVIAGAIALAAIIVGIWAYQRGRGAQQLSDATRANNQQREMLDAANRRPGSIASLAERMRRGDF